MSSEVTRRNFVSAATVGALGVVTVARSLAAATEPLKPASSSYEPISLPFDPQKVVGFSEKILVGHYENNYRGAVKRLNAITEQLGGLNFETAPGFVVNGLKREELIAANSMILHEIYFRQLGEPKRPGKALSAAIVRDFGSFEKWQSEFTATGRALSGGSGWVVLAYSQRDKRLRNMWAADHTTMPASSTVVLVLDMYEHAYQMDFGAKASDYVTAFMNVLNWSAADALYHDHGGV